MHRLHPVRSGHSTGAVEDSKIALKPLAMHQLHPVRSGRSTGAVEDSKIVLKPFAMHQLHPGEQELLKTVKLH